jgi:hypothetical protein
VTALPSFRRLSDPLSVSFDNGDKKWVEAYFGWLSFNGWRPGYSSADSSVSSYRVSIYGNKRRKRGALALKSRASQVQGSKEESKPCICWVLTRHHVHRPRHARGPPETLRGRHHFGSRFRWTDTLQEREVSAGECVSHRRITSIHLELVLYRYIITLSLVLASAAPSSLLLTGMLAFFGLASSCKVSASSPSHARGSSVHQTTERGPPCGVVARMAQLA